MSDFSVQEARRLRRQHACMRDRVFQGGSFQGAVGASPEMAPLHSLLSRAAERLAPVALHGESGTGKELSPSSSAA